MLGIVVLNYNTWEETKELIVSVDKYYEDKKKIYIVDNNSKEEIPKEVLDYFEQLDYVEVIWNKENKGYSAGNNLGIQAALRDNCEYILISNSDILVVDDTIQKMIDFMKKSSDIGIVGPQIYNDNGEFQPFYMLSKLTGSGKIKLWLAKTPLRKMVSKFENSFICYQELLQPKKVFGVSGCFFLMSNACAKYLNPWDENVFLYEEEYIMGVRLESTKYDVYIIPNTHIIHKCGVSTKGMTKFSYQCLIDSEQYYLKEYIGENNIICIIILGIRKILKNYI